MHNARLLRSAFLANATFSTLTATAMLIAGAPLSAAMGLNTPLWLYALVPGLYGFAVLLVLQARARVIWRRAALLTCVADLGWVVGSIALLVVAGHALSWAGVGLVVAVAAVVGLLGEAQLLGLARLRRAEPAPAV